jgi:hypothetical protein
VTEIAISGFCFVKLTAKSGTDKWNSGDNIVRVKRPSGEKARQSEPKSTSGLVLRL